MKCPACSRRLKAESTVCVCGWNATPAPDSRPFCSTVGCEQRVKNGALGGKCEGCALRVLQLAADATCAANGLKTPEEMRAFVKRKLRGFGHGSFEHWASHIKQEAVDYLVRGASRDDLRTLERLREAGAIDEKNRAIPVEQRERKVAA